MKRTWLKMGKKKLRKRSKSKATLDKADRALQDYMRREHKGEPCEVCGRQFQVSHHHLEKSKSNAGRFLEDNLILLCHACHSKITFGDHSVVASYSLKRGPQWFTRMEELKKVRKEHYSKVELEGIIKQY